VGGTGEKGGTVGGTDEKGGSVGGTGEKGGGNLYSGQSVIGGNGG